MATIRFRRNTSVEWAMLNPILSSGEPGYETDTGKEKRGDGVTRWNELDYFLPETAVKSLIDEAIENANPGTPEGLLAHILSDTPHPAYDDGPSLLLLYQNRKV